MTYGVRSIQRFVIRFTWLIVPRKIDLGGRVAEAANQEPVKYHELLILSLAETDALAKLLIEKGVMT